MNVELNREDYRCVIPGKGYGGRWEFLYKGNWYPVKNYMIKKALNERVLEEKDAQIYSNS